MHGAKIAVVGAGLMGHGIAQVFAEAGHPVSIHDPQPETLASVPARVAANLGILGRDVAAAGRIRLQATLEAAVADAEFVFEAAPEKLPLKQVIFAKLEKTVAAGTILASNTSVIPIMQIAAGLDTPGRVVGTHWWNPPYLVPLVEVVQAERTEPAVVQRTLALLQAVGKEPVHVRRDIPGFVGNRLQHALLREAFALVADGVCDAETVDRVVKSSFGPRLAVLGPMEGADYVGLDLALDVQEFILPDLDRSPTPSPYLSMLVEQGRLGMKTGAGFRSWDPEAAVRMRERLLRHLMNALGEA
ncbi:3-hydroxyacyl-CoA dehydrogenase family protein [Actinoplanes subtropicus]|uniref:3-hydroxyacyl-CoA dehydrogenase family protein n=1 Tax=Actinoplanes subtropicus TaxID=543632 RepID=UPI0004C3A254|nr:3-hydroxyacyl-CoA dehydrogenase NAD-binding domain-containing protein [Actinoplanes subtropicus]